MEALTRGLAAASVALAVYILLGVEFHRLGQCVGASLRWLLRAVAFLLPLTCYLIHREVKDESLG